MPRLPDKTSFAGSARPEEGCPDPEPVKEAGLGIEIYGNVWSLGFRVLRFWGFGFRILG